MPENFNKSIGGAYGSGSIGSHSLHHNRGGPGPIAGHDPGGGTRAPGTSSNLGAGNSAAAHAAAPVSVKAGSGRHAETLTRSRSKPQAVSTNKGSKK